MPVCVRPVVTKLPEVVLPTVSTVVAKSARPVLLNVPVCVNPVVFKLPDVVFATTFNVLSRFAIPVTLKVLSKLAPPVTFNVLSRFDALVTLSVLARLEPPVTLSVPSTLAAVVTLRLPVCVVFAVTVLPVFKLPNTVPSVLTFNVSVFATALKFKLVP